MHAERVQTFALGNRVVFYLRQSRANMRANLMSNATYDCATSPDFRLGFAGQNLSFCNRFVRYGLLEQSVKQEAAGV